MPLDAVDQVDDAEQAFLQAVTAPAPAPAPAPVPIPSNPTNPAGGSGTASTFFNLRSNYADNDEILPPDYNNLINLLDNVGAGALAAIGAGTIEGGDSTGAAGLGLTVNAWRGILPNSASRVGFAPGFTQATPLTIPASTTFVVWAVPVAGTWPDAASTPYDTAETGVAALEVVTDGSTPDGGTPLVSGVSSASALSGLTDARVPIGTASIAAALAAQVGKEAADLALLEAAIGARYFGITPPTPLDTRVTAIEVAAGGGPAIQAVGYWGNEARSGTDATTVPAYVAAQIAPPTAAPTPAPLVVDVEAVAILKNCFQLLELTYAAAGGGSAGMAAAQAYAATLVDVLLIRPGITNPALIDTVNSTAPINLTTGEIG